MTWWRVTWWIAHTPVIRSSQVETAVLDSVSCVTWNKLIRHRTQMELLFSIVLFWFCHLRFSLMTFYLRHHKDRESVVNVKSSDPRSSFGDTPWSLMCASRDLSGGTCESFVLRCLRFSITEAVFSFLRNLSYSAYWIKCFRHSLSAFSSKLWDIKGSCNCTPFEGLLFVYRKVLP